MEFKIISRIFGECECQISQEDCHLLDEHGWFIKKGGKGLYIHAKINKKCIGIHRIIMGTVDTDKLVDHINGNPLDNRRENLRITTKQQNCCNQRKRVGSSKFKGVVWHKMGGGWIAQIGVNYKRYHLGSFKSEIEAAKAYNDAAIKYHGEFACLNVIE